MAKTKARLEISYARIYKGQSASMESYKQANGKNAKS